MTTESLATQKTMSSLLPLPLVGRQQELALTMDYYGLAKGGHSHVVLLTGEPGIGKTRLLDEIARCVLQDEAIVLRGSASEAEGMPPYLPFLEALGQYIHMTPLDKLRTQITPRLQILTSVFPELAMYLGDVSTSYVLPAGQAHLRLYEALGSFLEVIGAPHAVVLLLDDLQWADTASLDLLCYLGRRQSNAHLLIVGAYRDGELERNAALSRTITELSRQRVLRDIPIKALLSQEIELLATSFLGGPLHSTVSSLLFTQSEGNPFFTEELLRHWVETGALTQKHRQWIAAVPLERTLPPSLVGAIRQRLVQFSTALIDNLRVAAIIGRTFSPSLLAAIQQKELEVVEEHLLEAVHARLVYADRQGDFIFSHDKIRECLYAEVSVSRRRRLHGMIGHLLEARFGHQEATQPMYQLAELALHFTHSNDLERGIDYSLRAAQALHTFAPEEALAHYHTALRLLPPDDKRRGDILLKLGEVALIVGQEGEAEHIYLEAQGWFTHRKERETLARATHGLGRAYWRQDRRIEACAAFERVITLLENHCCPVLVEARADLAVLLTAYMGQQEEGSACAQRALAMAHELGDMDLEMRVRRIVTSNLAALRVEDMGDAIQFVERMQTQAEACGNMTEAAECCFHLIVAYYWLAEIRRSQTASTHLLTIIEHRQQPYYLRTVYTFQVLSFASLGAWTDAEQMVARAHTIVDTLTDPIPLAFLHQCCGFLAYQQENYLIAERELQDAQVDQSLQSGLGDIMFYLGLLGLVQAAMGKEEVARVYMAQLEEHLALLPTGILPTAPLMVCLALIGLTLGDFERVKCLYPNLLAFQGQQYWFLVDRVLGMLALHENQWDTAAKHLAAAEAMARSEGLYPELARTLQAQAKIEMAQEGQENIWRARALLEEALVLFERLGMEHSIQLCRNQLHAHSPPTTTSQHPPPQALPANLTQREVMVLKLVVSGKSNRQIAQELGITEKTVTNHLTHIFNKTMCDNRVAATAFAIRHGLA